MGAFEIHSFDAGTNSLANMWQIVQQTGWSLSQGAVIRLRRSMPAAQISSAISLAGGPFWNGLKGANCRVLLFWIARPRSGKKRSPRVCQTIKGLCAMFFTNPFKSRLPEAEEALKGEPLPL